VGFRENDKDFAVGNFVLRMIERRLGVRRLAGDFGESTAKAAHSKAALKSSWRAPASCCTEQDFRAKPIEGGV